MANQTDQEQFFVQYVANLLASLKKLEEITGLKVVAQQAIAIARTLQGALQSGLRENSSAYFAQLLDAMTSLRESVETLTEGPRKQALEVFAQAQESALILSRKIQVGASTQYETLSDTATTKIEALKVAVKDAGAKVDIDVMIENLKRLKEQCTIQMIQSRFTENVDSALELATKLRTDFPPTCQTYFENFVESVHKIRESLTELSTEKKGNLWRMYTNIQESLLSLTNRLRFPQSLSELKSSVGDATGKVDMENASAALKRVLDEVKTFKKEKLEAAVTVAYEKATQLQKILQDGASDKVTNAYQTYEEAVASLHQLRVGLETYAIDAADNLGVTDRTAVALEYFSNAQESFVKLAQKIRGAERGHMLYSIKDKIIDTAIFLDDRYDLFQKVNVYALPYAEAALTKATAVIQNDLVASALNKAKTLDDKLVQGKVTSIVGQGYEKLEAGAAYIKEEYQGRQRQAMEQDEPSEKADRKVAEVEKEVVTEQEQIPVN